MDTDQRDKMISRATVAALEAAQGVICDGKASTEGITVDQISDLSETFCELFLTSIMVGIANHPTGPKLRDTAITLLDAYMSDREAQLLELAEQLRDEHPGGP